MEAEITYIAKDGRRFDDALKCEDYERSLGIIPGTVGNLLQLLEKRELNTYVSAIILVKSSDGNKNLYLRHTVCCDDCLDDYVNVNDLSEDKRYISNTVGGLVKELRNAEKDAPVQYTIVFSNDKSFSNPGVMCNYNHALWK